MTDKSNLSSKYNLDKIYYTVYIINKRQEQFLSG